MSVTDYFFFSVSVIFGIILFSLYICKKDVSQVQNVITIYSRFFLFVSAAEVQAIASMIEKQAQIVVKQKEVSEESKKRKEALLAQYANVTDEEEYPLLSR